MTPCCGRQPDLTCQHPRKRAARCPFENAGSLALPMTLCLRDVARVAHGNSIMNDTGPLTITFRCPPELEPILPRPIPAVLGLADWFKTMPQKSFSTVLQTEQMTVKKCPPFIDAMTFGFLIPLIADIHAEDGMLTWDRDVPAGALTNYSRSPIDFHDNNQVVGTPFYEEDR